MTYETYNMLFSFFIYIYKNGMAVSKTTIKFKYNPGNQNVFHT